MAAGARRCVAMGPRPRPGLAQLLPAWRSGARRHLATGAPPDDLYAVLGVRPDASPEEIRAAFLARSKEVHPDGDPGDAGRHGRFVQLAAAYGVLRREGTRRAYDRQRRPPAAPPRPPGGAGGRWSAPGAAPDTRYWEQFRPPGPPPGATQRRWALGACLLLGALGALAHGLAYRLLAQAHAGFMEEKDRRLAAAYERVRERARAEAPDELLRRLRQLQAQRRRRGGTEP